MLKRIRECTFAILVITTVTAVVPYSAIAANTFASDTAENEVRLVIDSENKQELPKHFRKASEKVNFAGLNTLNISGSHQFSEKGLSAIKESIGTSLPITIVDLRQESHGFINGTAVSWANDKNNANEGLTKEQVLLGEDKRLQNILLNQPILLYYHDHETIVPQKIENESRLVKSQGMSYVRIPVTDGKIPTDEMVDYFIEFVKSQPKDTWIHFHCRAGVGRTTTFMIMYDMMKNSKQVSSEDIIKRQVLLAKLCPKSRDSFYSDERIGFLNNFYKYCRENADNFNTPWSKWVPQR